MFPTSIQEVKALIDNYSALIEKAAEIVDGYHFNAESIEYNNETNELMVYGTETCLGETYGERYDIPMSWLFLTPEQLKDAKAEKKKKDMLARQAYQKEKSEKEAREKEIKEKAEYERLKAKYKK